MAPASWLKLYALCAALFLAIDLAWIGGVAGPLYKAHLGHLLRDSPLWMPGLLFYALYVAGILVFAVAPGLAAGSLPRTIALGSFLGLLAYATYDLTAMALFRDFPPIVVIGDLMWGALVTGTVAAAGFGMGRWLGLG